MSPDPNVPRPSDGKGSTFEKIALALIATFGAVITAAIAAPDKVNQLIHWQNHSTGISSQASSAPAESKPANTAKPDPINRSPTPGEVAKKKIAAEKAAADKAAAEKAAADKAAADKAVADKAAADKAAADKAAAEAAKEDAKKRTPTLILHDIRQDHNGAPGHIEWSFEIRVNGRPLPDVSVYRFVGDQRTVQVGRDKPIVWTPQALTSPGPFVIHIIGHQIGGSLVAEGIATMPDDPTVLTEVTVQSPHAALGGAEFHFDFTMTY
jgi:hypothetical protein